MEARSQLRHRPTLRRESAHTSGAIFILSQPRSLVKPGARLTSANQFTLRQPYSWNNSASGGVYFTKPQDEIRRGAMRRRRVPEAVGGTVHRPFGALRRLLGTPKFTMMRTTP